MPIPSGWSYDQTTGVLTAPEGTTEIPTYGCNNFPGEKVIIPEGITSIGYGAFRNSSSLREVTLPSTLVTIDELAFEGCSAIESIVIPDGVTTIAGSAFNKCSNLSSINFPSSLSSIGDYAFGETGFTEFTVPDESVEIGSYILRSCQNLQTLIYNSANFADYRMPAEIALDVKSIRDIYINATKDTVISNGIDAQHLDSNNKYIGVTGNWDITMHFSDDADYDTWKDKFETSNGNNGTTEPSVPETPDTGDGNTDGNTDGTEPTPPTDTPTGEEYFTITPELLELLVTQILGKVNERIASRIVTTVSESSDDNHVPSALAVFNCLRTLAPCMSCTTVVGSMDTITEPNSQIIYLQKDDESDPTWSMYLWVDNEWVVIGDTSIDLVNYWSKSEADITELRQKMLDQTGIDIIKTALGYDELFKDNSATKDIILGWIETAGIGNITEAGMGEIITSVMEETDKVYVRQDQMTVITSDQIITAVNNAFTNTDPKI